MRHATRRSDIAWHLILYPQSHKMPPQTWLPMLDWIGLNATESSPHPTPRQRTAFAPSRSTGSAQETPKVAADVFQIQ